jgi:deoxyribose-phosphate aldolase
MGLIRLHTGHFFHNLGKILNRRMIMELARYIDHTLLKPEATWSDVEKLCQEALKYNFAAVCVNPIFVAPAAKMLSGSDVGIATVVGFPLGATTSGNKAFEAAEAVKNGATEVDMVMSVGLFKGGDLDAVREDVASVVSAVPGIPVKVILETGFLSKEEVGTASTISADAGAAYVKTSTGFGPRGASVEDILTMRTAVGDRCKIKASGGVRTRDDAVKMIEAGASRIGTSAGIAIVSGN